MALIGKNISTGDLNRIGTKVHLAMNNALLEREEKGKEYNDDHRNKLAQDTALSICKTLGITISDNPDSAAQIESLIHKTVIEQIEQLIADRRSFDKISITSYQQTKQGYLAVVLYSWGEEGTEAYHFLEEAMAIYREQYGPKKDQLYLGWTRILSE